MPEVSDVGYHGQIEIDALMRAFYEVISFEDDGAPDWAQMAMLFSPHARITRVTPEGIDYMDLASFRNMAEELIEVGAFTSFFERETARRLDRFGSVLHVASAYETRVSRTAVDYVERGINSLQIVHERGQWKILSLCWDTAAPYELGGLHAVRDGGVSYGAS